MRRRLSPVRLGFLTDLGHKTAFHASFQDHTLAKKQDLKISRITSIVGLSFLLVHPTARVRPIIANINFAGKGPPSGICIVPRFPAQNARVSI